jgi:pSer/pThr/pTyr-binding forkhead associated (FHA) protein
MQVSIMIMSGVDDGQVLTFSSENGDGEQSAEAWTITIGRREDNDICLRNDTFSSRYHAKLHWMAEHWWLEDCNSKNGTFIEDDRDDVRVVNNVPIEPGQLFRVGRTWMRIQAAE